tara:strand:- start:228 stop:452 length:225 start_codon:yes stop_codon:yes gene_type:complete
MVKINIQENEYETDDMTDEQKGLVENIHQGQVTEEKLKVDIACAMYALKSTQGMRSAQTTRLKALLDDGKKDKG